jgi:hypothetical protein
VIRFGRIGCDGGNHGAMLSMINKETPTTLEMADFSLRHVLGHASQSDFRRLAGEVRHGSAGLVSDDAHGHNEGPIFCKAWHHRRARRASNDVQNARLKSSASPQVAQAEPRRQARRSSIQRPRGGGGTTNCSSKNLDNQQSPPYAELCCGSAPMPSAAAPPPRTAVESRTAVKAVGAIIVGPPPATVGPANTTNLVHV